MKSPANLYQTIIIIILNFIHINITILILLSFFILILAEVLTAFPNLVFIFFTMLVIRMFDEAFLRRIFIVIKQLSIIAVLVFDTSHSSEAYVLLNPHNLEAI